MKKKIGEEKIRKEIKALDWILATLFILVCVYFIFNYKSLKNYLAGDIASYGLAALFTFVFLVEFIPQVISPDYPLLLAIFGGANIFSATIVTMIASFAGSLLGFLVGRKYGIKFVYNLLDKSKSEKVFSFWDKYGNWFVLASAVLPLPIPYFPVIFGALKMEMKEFFLWGLIPRALGFIATALLAYYGIILLS